MSKKPKRHSQVIEFGRKGFYNKIDIRSEGPLRFEVDGIWRDMGYLHPARYPRNRRTEVLDWCAEHAPNAHLNNDPGRAVLFKDETVATMFRLTFSEGG